MRLPTLSEIGKGPLFANNDVMGLGEGGPAKDENWAYNKEEEIVAKFKNGEMGLTNKDTDLKAKIMAGRDKLLNSESGMKAKVFSDNTFNFKMNNKKMFRGGNMYNKNYSKKVEDIMGKQQGSMGNYDNKVSMVMGNPSKKGGGFNVKAFDMKAKSYLSMGGKGMKMPSQKSKMLTASGGAPKNMNEYFGGVKKPNQTVNINALIGGAKQKAMPNMKPQGMGMKNMVMGAKTDMASQSKINSMLGQQAISGAKSTEVLARMGMYQKPEANAWNRMNVQKNLNLWGDADGDKVANILDCEPMNPMAQGWLHNLGSAVGGAIGKLADRDTQRGREHLQSSGETTIVQKDLETAKEKTGSFVKGKVVEPVKKFAHWVKYKPGTNLTRKDAKKIGRLEDKELEAKYERDTQIAKYGSQAAYEKELDRQKEIKMEELKTSKTTPADEAKLLKARADMIRAQKVTGTIKGKKGKYQDIYGDVQQEQSGGVTGAFGSGAGIAQMTHSPSTGAGFQMADLRSTGAGFQMASLSGGETGMGYREMANIQTGSGQGFHQMLGSQPPMPEPQPMEQPPAEPEEKVETPSENMMMVDGVKYTKLPSGMWKNTKTGKEVTYPRGKYND